MIRYLTYLLIIVLLTSACTNARWIARDDQAIDEEDYRELSSRQILIPSGNLTPEDPVLRLQVFSENTYAYSKRVIMARYIQDYKIRPFFFALGLMGAGAAFYAANSSAVSGVDTQLETVTLNVIGGIIGLSAFLNFKPSGDPRPTGEERLLRKTGLQIVTDTVRVTDNPVQDSAVVDILYGDQTVAENQNINISGGVLEIDLGTQLSNLEITGSTTEAVRVSAGFSDSTYSYEYPLSSVLSPFIKVTTSVTELRNAPEESSDNVLAELVEGSQLQIAEVREDDWYKVLYGISENYVSKSDVVQIWRTPDFVEKDQVVTIPSVAFGNIDVENNIPILTASNPDGVGLIIGNENYRGEYSNRKYADRDIRLVRTYLTNALGYPDKNIFTLEDFNNGNATDSVLTHVREAATDSSDVFVYLSGYGTILRDGGDFTPYLLSSSGQIDSSVNLINLFNAVAGLPSRSTVIVNDIEFRRSGNSDALQSFQQPLYNAATLISGRHPNLAILFSSEIGQRSHIYLGNGGEDKKHHVFPYFFARALQRRTTVLSQIYRYLRRNVSYTSRRLHDQSQDPMIFGNQTIDLANRQ